MVLHPLDPANPHPPPFMVNDGRARIGLRLTGDDEWLHEGDDGAAQRAAKADHVARHAADSVLAEPAATAACEELLTMLEAATGRVGDRTLHPIDAAGRLVAEDLCVLEGSSLRLVAGSVVYPQGWLLADKLGATMRAVHDPVPHYGSLADAADRVVAGLDERVRWRMNWFVVGDDRLRAEPGSRPRRPVDVHLRFERQTLRRLPVTGAVVFTIRTYLAPLAALDGRRDLQRGLLRALDTMAPAERDYHGNHEPAELAVDHLRAALSA